MQTTRDVSSQHGRQDSVASKREGEALPVARPSLRQLQRQYGNRYVQRVVARARGLEYDGRAGRDVE
ncbi:MAG: hypothetical protein ACRD2A_22215, partial [Vicinamibacterales bacterium]